MARYDANGNLVEEGAGRGRGSTYDADGNLIVTQAAPTETAPSRDIPDVQASTRAPRPSRGFLGGVHDWITGGNTRQRGVREFSFSDLPDTNVETGASAFLPRVGRALGGNDATQQALRRLGTTADATFGGHRWALEGGFFLDANERNRAAMIRQQVPTAEFRRDEYGNLQVRTLPDAPWRYLNAPGFSQNDVETFLTEGARHVPDALLSALPQGWGLRAFLGAGGAATNTYASQEAAQTVGGEGANPGDVIMSGIGGGGGQLAGDALAAGGPMVESAVARALRNIESSIAPIPSLRAGPVTQATGTVTAPGLAQRVRQTVGDMAQAAETSASGAIMRDAPQNARAERFYELADEFGVEGARRGQASANIEDIASEQRALRGGSGQRAHEIIKQSEEDILQGLHAAGRDLPVRQEPRVSSDIGEAGRELQAGIRARREQLAEARDRLYDNAEPQLRTVTVTNDAPHDLMEAVTSALRERGVLGPSQGFPNSNVYPATTQALNLVRQRIPEAARAAPPSPGVVRVYSGLSPEQAQAARLSGALEPGASLSARRDIARAQGPVVLETDIPRDVVRIDLNLPNGQVLDVNAANDFTGNIGWTLDDYVRNGYTLAVEAPAPLTPSSLQAREAGSLFDWEAVRKGLNKIQSNAEGLDADAIAVLMRNFDDWYETQAMPNAQALSAIQAARRAHRDLLDRFTQSESTDIGGRALERIYDLEQSGADVIDGVLGTRPGSVGSALAAVRRIKRIALDTPEARAAFESGDAIPAELEALREATFYRIMEPIDRLFTPEGAAERTARPSSLPAERLATNLRQALDGDGQEIMRELFTPEEIAKVRRFRELAEMLIPPPGAVNFSGTAYEGARMIRGVVARMAESLFGGPGLILSFPFQMLENTYTRLFRAAIAKRALSRAMPIRLSGQPRTKAVATGAALATVNDGSGE